MPSWEELVEHLRKIEETTTSLRREVENLRGIVLSPASVRRHWTLLMQDGTIVPVDGSVGAAGGPFTVGTSETAIAHGLPRVPVGIAALPLADVRVRVTKAPDERYIYLAASGACTCYVMVIP